MSSCGAKQTGRPLRLGASRFLRGGKAQPVKYLKTIGETAKTGFFVPLLIAEMVYNRNSTGKTRFYRPSLLTLCAETALHGERTRFHPGQGALAKGAVELIEVKHLSKRYGNHLAVDDLSFSVEKGIIYGFLGPNGAGKSTTMNILTGCLGASAGEVLIDGHSIMDEPMAAKRQIGYLPEMPPLYPDMTVEEYLRFVADAKGLSGREKKGQVLSVMEKTRVTDMRKRLIKNLSKGYRQRVGIAQALLGNPEIIILDEPTVGLDPKQIIEIREMIRELGKEHTVILSSHILSEVQAVCDSILIISKGKLVACDTAENLDRLFAGENNYHMEPQ